MQIPQELQKFSEPTLIVITDSQRAQFWLAGGDALETLDGVALVPEPKSDHEGQVVNPAGGRAARKADEHDTSRKEQFASLVAGRITDLFRARHADHLRLASLPEILHRIEHHLPQEIRKQIVSQTPKDLLPFSVLEALQHILKA